MSNKTWSWMRRLIAALLIGTGITISINVSIDVDVNEPPVPAESLGWLGPEAVDQAQDVVAQMPPFQIVGQTGDHRDDTVLLWHYSLIANNGDHLPNYPQQVGDCVSFGVKNAVEYLECRQIYHEGKTHRFRPIYPPYPYATSRVLVGKKRIKGDGSVGAWAAKAVQEYGLLFADEASVPEYSGRIARDWGRNGPPEEFLRLAREYPVETVAKVSTADEVCNAVCNGYPVTIASNFGTRTIREVDGRMVANWDARWAHQMCIVGYDGSQTRKYFYVLNSWGENAHPQPLNGEPPGGFWITWDDCDRIVDQGDSFAYSDFEGFPAAELDFTIIGQQTAAHTQHTIREEREMQTICQNLTDPIWYSLAALVAIAGILLLLFDRHRCKCTALLLLSCALTSTAASADEPTSFDVFGVAPATVAEVAPPTVFDLFGVQTLDRTALVQTSQKVVNPAFDYFEFQTLDRTAALRPSVVTQVQDLIDAHYIGRQWSGESARSCLLKHGYTAEHLALFSDDVLAKLHAAIHERDQGHLYPATRYLPERTVTKHRTHSVPNSGCQDGVCRQPR